MNTRKLILLAVVLSLVLVLAGCGSTYSHKTAGSAESGLSVVGWSDTTTGFYRPVLGHKMARSE
ncbi:MAG: hypothetical protein JXN61_02380 [Sedimentisphaerales bacterium]|nr:hypothetical protein [Sedimentisphaerales bacterium]